MRLNSTSSRNITGGIVYYVNVWLLLCCSFKKMFSNIFHTSPKQTFVWETDFCHQFNKTMLPSPLKRANHRCHLNLEELQECYSLGIFPDVFNWKPTVSTHHASENICLNHFIHLHQKKCSLTGEIEATEFLKAKWCIQFLFIDEQSSN